MATTSTTTSTTTSNKESDTPNIFSKNAAEVRRPVESIDTESFSDDNDGSEFGYPESEVGEVEEEKDEPDEVVDETNDDDDDQKPVKAAAAKTNETSVVPETPLETEGVAEETSVVPETPPPQQVVKTDTETSVVPETPLIAEAEANETSETSVVPETPVDENEVAANQQAAATTVACIADLPFHLNDKTFLKTGDKCPVCHHIMTKKQLNSQLLVNLLPCGHTLHKICCDSMRKAVPLPETQFHCPECQELVSHAVSATQTLADIEEQVADKNQKEGEKVEGEGEGEGEGEKVADLEEVAEKPEVEDDEEKEIKATRKPKKKAAKEPKKAKAAVTKKRRYSAGANANKNVTRKKQSSTKKK